MKRRKHGFTLVEILIVLGIVVVLAALLFPLLGRVREKGRQATCQSNLKQLFLGVQHYIQDHDSRQPSFGNWRESMATYIKKSDVFVCPSIPEAIQRPDGITETGEYNFYIGFLNSLVTEHHGS